MTALQARYYFSAFATSLLICAFYKLKSYCLVSFLIYFSKLNASWTLVFCKLMGSFTENDCKSVTIFDIF